MGQQTLGMATEAAVTAEQTGCATTSSNVHGCFSTRRPPDISLQVHSTVTVCIHTLPVGLLVKGEVQALHGCDAHPRLEILGIEHSVWVKHC